MIAMFIVAVCISGNGFCDEATKVKSTLVVSVSFAFDGGSLVFELKSESKNFLLLVVHPNSYIRQRLGKDANLLVSKSKRFEPSETKIVTKEAESALINSMFEASEADNPLHKATLAYLLAKSYGRQPILWDSDAIEALEKGDWLACFAKSSEKE